MLNLTVWYASDDALVTDDVERWRTPLVGPGDAPQLFHGTVPESGSAEWKTMFRPSGFIDSGRRVVVVWNADKAEGNSKQKPLTTMLNAMVKRTDVTFHVGLVTAKTSLSKKVQDYDPDELSYALADGPDPTGWADDYLRRWCSATFDDAAYDHMELVASSDVALVAATVAQLCKSLGVTDDAENDDEDNADLTEISRSMLIDALARLGRAEFFDMTKAIDNADTAAVVDLAMRMKPEQQLPGLLTLQRRKMVVLAMRDGGISASEAKDIFRDRVSERAKIEDKRTKLAKRNKGIAQADIDKIVDHTVSPNQVDFLYNRGLHYTAQEATTIWKAIEKADFEAKSGGTSPTSLMEFGTTVALVNGIARKSNGSKKRTKR